MTRKIMIKGAVITKKLKTLDDVAKLAKVSPITVSRALRNPDAVSHELRQRIDSAVQKLAYVPNMAASHLASSRSHAVGVIVPTLYNVIFSEYLQSLHEVFLGSGFQVVVVNSRYSQIEEEQAIKTLLGQRVEAIIIVGVDHTPMARRLLEQSKVPVIETFELTENPINHNIGLSQSRAGCDATKFLLKFGHRKIGFIHGLLDVRAAARLRGYRQAMAEAGLSTEGLITTKQEYSHIALGGDIMSELAEKGSIPEAIFCIDDNLALGALMACRRLGLRVPDDITILGFHDLEFSAYSSPSLSSVATHRHALGKLAAETCIKMISGNTSTLNKQIDLGYEIVARQSTEKIFDRR